MQNMDDEGFEPSTFRMQNGRSTTELNAQLVVAKEEPERTAAAEQKVPLVGLEPTIFGLGSQRLIH